MNHMLTRTTGYCETAAVPYSFVRRVYEAVVLVAFLVAGGCRSGETSLVVDDHGHTHAFQATHWTDDAEVFIEHPAMVAGLQSGSWAIHVTRMRDFQPVTDGTLTLAFRGEDGTVYTTRSTAPVRPGIFALTPVLPVAGAYELVVDLDGPQLQDRLRAGQITVYADEAGVPHQHQEEHASHVAFLKEQQWSIDFEVVPALERGISHTIAVSGEIVPAAGRVAVVATPVSGLTPASANRAAPVPGDRVQAGQALAVLSPTSEGNSYAVAKARLERLEREVERFVRLYDVEAIPEKMLVEAQHDLEVARATMEAMGAVGGDDYDYVVRAPISGRVQSRRFTPGQRVEAGETLFEIVNLAEVWVHLHIQARHSAMADASRAAVFGVEGGERRYRAERLVTVGSALDPVRRTLPVLMAADNPDGSLKIGMFVEGLLDVGGMHRGVAVPIEAVLNQDGRPVAYVQTGGETFERRELALGPTDGTHTIVVRGLEAGERVVTKGAYDVYLASLGTSEIGDHGHPH